MKLIHTGAVVLLLTSFIPPTAVTAQDNAEGNLQALQGRWIRAVKTKNIEYKIVKVHTGYKTTVTVLGPDGKIVTAKESEFRLESTDRVKVFTFFNNRILVGPNKGQIDKKEKSYIYRIEGDRFIEAQGLLTDDRGKPFMIIWHRDEN